MMALLHTVADAITAMPRMPWLLQSSHISAFYLPEDISSGIAR